MLELARRVAKARPKAPVLFVTFTLEEPPPHLTRSQGSHVFVQQSRKSGNRVLGAIILEMVGFTSPRQHYPFLSRWPAYPAEGNFIGIIGNWQSRRRMVRSNAKCGCRRKTLYTLKLGDKILCISCLKPLTSA
jgi:hypothetical protein